MTPPVKDSAPGLTFTEERPFRWHEFLRERAAMIRYLRDVEQRSWDEIAALLSCDAAQVSVIHESATRAARLRKAP